MSFAPPLFEIEPFPAEALEGAGEMGRRGRSARPSAALRGPRRPRPRGPQRGAAFFDAYAQDGVDEPHTGPAPLPEASPRASEYGRWVQFTLNRALGTSLPVDGVMSAATRGALRAFQRQQGLPVSGFVGPDTEDALLQAGRARDGFEGELETKKTIWQRLTEIPQDLAQVAKTINTQFVGGGIPAATFQDAIARNRRRPGIYKLTRVDNGKFYHGKAERNLADRLSQHRWCMTHLGYSPDDFRVQVYVLPKYSPKQIRDIEIVLNSLYIRQTGRNANVLNTNLEFEFPEMRWIP